MTTTIEKSADKLYCADCDKEISLGGISKDVILKQVCILLGTQNGRVVCPNCGQKAYELFLKQKSLDENETIEKQ